MRNLLIIIVFVGISAHTQSYNSLYILKNEILQLDKYKNVYKLAPLDIHVEFNEIKPYEIEAYKTKVDKKNRHIVTNESSAYIFSKKGKLLYARVGSTTVLLNKFGKDSIIRKENKTLKELIIKKYFYKNNKLEKIDEYHRYNDTSFVQIQFKYKYPEEKVKVEEKTIVFVSDDLKKVKSTYLLSEWTVFTKTLENNSYKSKRKVNGIEDRWFQEKKYDKNGNLIWENEYWHDAISYEYDVKNRLTKKIINLNKKIYSYGYDEKGNRNSLTIEFDKFQNLPKSKIVVKVDYNYDEKTNEWTECHFDMDFIRFKNEKENIVDEVKYHVYRNTKNNNGHQ